MMIMFLVGLQAIPKKAQDASKVDGTSSLKLEGAGGLAQAKKADFVTRHGRLYCERCLCDPDKTYGKFGSACIEVHYAAEAMSEMDVPDQTRLEDLKCLCANCHRIVHAEFRSAQQQTK
jgi:5-methylcytosine-specific restriction protein A